MTKEDIFSKWNLKDYNNKLEKILETKSFSSDVKSLLLSMLYKIEVGYEDYSKVKTDVESKKEVVEKMIQKIEEDCKEIILVNPKSEESEKMQLVGNFQVLPEKQKIISYPNEKWMMEAISILSNREILMNEKYGKIKEMLSDFLQVGNCMNQVEIIRDFNGWSWSTVIEEIGDIEINLLYQDLRIVVGNPFLENWIHNKEYIIDYMDVLREKLEENYGDELGEKYEKAFLETLVRVMIERSPNQLQQWKDKEVELKEELEQIKNKSKYLAGLSNKRKEILKKIETIDDILNNKEKLEKEFIKRNEESEDKIFSMLQLSKMLSKERNNAMEQRRELQEKMDPKKFVQKKDELLQKLDFIAGLHLDKPDAKQKTLLSLQLIEIQCLEEKIKKLENKKEILEMIYQIRYFHFVPFLGKEKIKDKKELQKALEKLEKEIIEKAIEHKVINKINIAEEWNFEILRSIFYMRMIELENLEIEIQLKDDKYEVLYFDGEEIERTREFAKEDKRWKINRRMKVFN